VKSMNKGKVMEGFVQRIAQNLWCIP